MYIASSIMHKENAESDLHFGSGTEAPGTSLIHSLKQVQSSLIPRPVPTNEARNVEHLVQEVLERCQREDLALLLLQFRFSG